MKYYRAVIQPNEHAQSPTERINVLLKMELTFTVGDGATHIPVGAMNPNPVPATANDIVKGVIHDLHLTGIMCIIEIKEITREAAEQYA